MSTKTSTAALDSVSHKSLRTPCRLPRHPAGASTRPSGSARTRNAPRSKPERDKNSQFVQQAHIAIARSPEEVALTHHQRRPTVTIRTIVPVVLRITLSLVLWTLGFAMSPSSAERDHRIPPTTNVTTL